MLPKASTKYYIQGAKQEPLASLLTKNIGRFSGEKKVKGMGRKRTQLGEKTQRRRRRRRRRRRSSLEVSRGHGSTELLVTEARFVEAMVEWSVEAARSRKSRYSTRRRCYRPSPSKCPVANCVI